MRNRLLNVFFLFLLVIASSYAADYYVSTTGSDSNDGSFTNPFRTIQHAADNVGPGDYVYIRAGTYTENNPGTYGCANDNERGGGIILCTSGTSANPITFTSYGNEDVIIDQNYNTPGFYINNRNYIIIKDIAFREVEFSAVSTFGAETIIINNITVTGADGPGGYNIGGVFLQDCNNCEVRDSTFSNIRVNGQNNANAAGIHGYRRTNNIMSGNTIFDAFNGIYYKQADGSSPSNEVMEKNHIYDTTWAIQIGDNTGNFDNFLIENNIIENTKSGLYTFNMPNQGRNLIFRNNIIRNFDGTGDNSAILLKGFRNGVISENNVIERGNNYVIFTINDGNLGRFQTSDNNCFHWDDTDGLKFYYRAYGNSYHTDIGGWQSASGHDSNSVVDSSSPLNNDFTLKSSSPCASISNLGPTVDLCEIGDDSICESSNPPPSGICEATGNNNCYYVSTSGSDSNDGSFGSPFGSISHAATLAQAGDFVYIRTGTYSEYSSSSCHSAAHNGIAVCNSGTINDPITFKAYDNENVIINQNDAGSGFIIDAENYITIQDLTILNTLQAGIWITTAGATGIKILNLTIIGVDNLAGMDTNTAGVKLDECDNCEVINSTISNIKFNGETNGNSAGIHSYRLNNVLIEGNTISDANQGFFHKQADTDVSGIVRNNYFYDLVNNGVRLGTNSGYYQGIEIYNNLFDNMASAFDSSSTMHSGGGDNLMFSNNIVLNVDRGIVLAGFDEGNYIFNNVFGGDTDRAIYTVQEGNFGVITNSDNNCFYSSTGDVGFWFNAYGTPTQSNLASWISATGFDSNSIAPSINPLNGDNSLNPSSECSSIPNLGVEACSVGDNPTCDSSNGGNPGDTQSPTGPSSFTSTGKTSSSVSLTWSGASDNVAIQDFIIRYGSSQITVTGSSTTITGLIPETSYTFTIQARDTSGNLGSIVSGPTVITDPVNNGGGNTPLTNECNNWQTNHPEWIWCDDFEAPLVTGPNSYFEVNDDNGEFIRINGLGINSSHGMRALWQSGEDEAGNLHLAFGRTPSYINSNIRNGEDFREIYYRHYIRHDDNWQGNPFKLSRSTIFTDGTWGSQAMIAHIWEGSGNFLKLDPVTCVTGSTVDCIGYNDWNNMDWSPENKESTYELYLNDNAKEWTCIEARVKLNDPGQQNGEFDLYINDQLDTEIDNLDLVDSFTGYGINIIYLENFWNDGPSVQRERYWDNFVVSTQRIGCGDLPDNGGGNNGGGSTNSEYNTELSPVEDTFLNVNDDKNYQSNSLNTYTWPANTPANTILLDFDFSSIPNDAVVTSAVLELYQYQAGGDSSYDLTVHRLLNYDPIFSETDGDEYSTGNLWSTVSGFTYPMALGDISSVYATSSLDNTNGYKTWEIKDLVQYYIDNPSQNYGIFLNSDDVASQDSYRFFRSKDFSDSSQHPKLTVYYNSSSGGSSQTCGNNIVEGTETCDGNSNPSTCTEQGYSYGNISCNSACDGYVVSSCVLDNIAPVMSSFAPVGESLAIGTTSQIISLTTDEDATCRFSSFGGIDYSAMTNTSSNTGGTSHSHTISGLNDGTSYTYYIKCIDSYGNSNSNDGVISFNVLSDTTPPIISNEQPSGTQVFGTTTVDLSLTTDESSTCKYNLGSDMSYSTMTNTFSSSDGLSHSRSVSTSNGETYTYYVRCQDNNGNSNNVGNTIMFSVAGDTESPVIRDLEPTETLESGTDQVLVSLTTSEPSLCRYGINPNTWENMNDFTTSGNQEFHTTTYFGLADGSTTTLYIECRDLSPNANSVNTTFDITVEPDNTAPELTAILLDGQTLSSGTTSATLSFTTDEDSTCRYNESDLSFSGMNSLTNTGGTSHSTVINDLADASNYTYYVRCRDSLLNINDPSIIVSFSVEDPGDITAPEILEITPNSTLAYTQSVDLTVRTNEGSYCRYSTSDLQYDEMTTTMGSTLSTIHTVILEDLSTEVSHRYYVSCSDGNNNEMTMNKFVTFLIDPPIDNTAPILSNLVPVNGVFSNITTSAILSLETDEISTCKYTDTLLSFDYDNVGSEFTNTDSLNHNVALTNLDTNRYYEFYVKCKDANGNVNSPAAILNFTIGDPSLNNVTDNTSPVILNFAPTGELAESLTNVTLEVQTDENSICRFDTVDKVYNDLSNNFGITGENIHQEVLSNLVTKTNLTYYVRCTDSSLNSNNVSKIISFSLGPITTDSGDDDDNDNGGGSSSGGSGGGGSSSSNRGSSSLTILNDDICAPSYTYSDWSTCLNNRQSRAIRDSNNCEDTKFENRYCEVLNSEIQNKFLNAKILDIQKDEKRKRTYRTILESSYNEIFKTEEKLEDDSFILVDDQTGEEYLGRIVEEIESEYFYSLERIDGSLIGELKAEGLVEKTTSEKLDKNFKDILSSNYFKTGLFVFSILLILAFIYYVVIYVRRVHD